MAFGENRDPRHTTIRREVVKMDVQECSACDLNTSFERLSMCFRSSSRSAPYRSMSDECRRRRPHPAHKIVLALFLLRRSKAPGKLFFRLGGA